MRTINTIQQKEPSAELWAGTPTESTEPTRVNQNSTNTPTVQPHSRDHTTLEKMHPILRLTPDIAHCLTELCKHFTKVKPHKFTQTF